MRKAIVALAFVVCLSALPAYAAAPLNGVYACGSGAVKDGRFSEAWIGGGQGAIGNTVHAASWDGTALGTQWEVFCPVLNAPPVLIDDTVDGNGNGHRTYRTTYVGGTFWMTGAAAWGGGDPFYTGICYDYVHTTTMQFLNWQMVGYDTNAQLKGLFDDYESCIMLTIANAEMMGMGGIPPAGYPVLRDGPAGCVDASGFVGEWGNVFCITLVIANCGLSTEETTWGAVKSLYH